MKTLILIALSMISATAFSSEQVTNGSCKVVDQSWSMESFYCTAHGYPNDKPFRCYAIVESEGHRFKVWGSTCYATPYDCAFGEGKVEACD